ncbi:MAG: hypothetical protein ACK5MR_09705 [Cumulibacter sp.]
MQCHAGLVGDLAGVESGGCSEPDDDDPLGSGSEQLLCCGFDGVRIIEVGGVAADEEGELEVNRPGYSS